MRLILSWLALLGILWSGVACQAAPPEEPLLLAFITVWAIVLHRIAGKVTGEDPA